MEIPPSNQASSQYFATAARSTQPAISFASILSESQPIEAKLPSQPQGPDDNDVVMSGTDSGVSAGDEALQKVFNDFVGQTFFAELIKSYRSTQNTVPYFNGGQAEKIFQGQLDQKLAENLSERSADQIAGPMFEQFRRSRSSAS